MKNTVIVSSVLVLMILAVSQPCAAWEAQDDPLAGLQQPLSERITTEFDKLWDGCNRLVRQPIDTEEKAKQYLECFFGNLPNFIRFWADESKTTLSTSSEALSQIMLQQMPAGDNGASERQNVLGVGVFTHRKLAAWHQRFADMANSLAAANFLVRSELQGVLQEVQTSMNECTTRVRALAEELNKDVSLSREDLEKKCMEYLKEMFTHPGKVLDKYQITMLNATKRAERQFSTMLQRSSTDYREFAKAYEEFFTKIFDSLNTCAINLWTLKSEG